jgi:hypothetical protein
MPTHVSPTLISERIKKTRNEAEFVPLKTSVLREDHINRKALELGLREIVLAIKQIIEAFKLTAAE